MLIVPVLMAVTFFFILSHDDHHHGKRSRTIQRYETIQSNEIICFVSTKCLIFYL